MFLENVLDPAHVPVSHHGIVGNRYNDSVPLGHVRMPSRSEVPVTEGGEYNPLYPEDRGFKHQVINARVTDTFSTNDFRPPCLNKITSVLPSGAMMILALYATPTKPGYCRHVGAQILVKPKSGEGKKAAGLGFYGIPMPTWLLHVAASLFLVSGFYKR
jgi:Pheophorbide a oxygenase